MARIKKTYLHFANLRAKLGGKSRSSIYRDIENGDIPAPIKIGSRLYWLEDEVDEWLVARRNGDR